MSTLQRILVPFDYSPAADAALRLAADLARACGAGLLICHFAELEISTLGDYPLIKGDPLERESERLRTHVRRVVADADRAIPEWEIEATWGFPVLRIVETVVHRAVDLIVMGTADRSSAQHVLLGPITEQLVRLAPCPILTVPAPRDASAERHPAFAPSPTTGRVAGVMSTSLITIAPDDTLASARDHMSAAKIRHLPVVEAGRLVGILSDVDFPAHRGRLGEAHVCAAMTAEPVTITPDATVETAARLMITQHVRALPVVDHDRVVGMLSIVDVLEDYVRASRSQPDAS